MKEKSLLVGAHFRPPAKALLAVLPAGARLEMQAEPTNPYDANAVAVWVRPQEIPESQWPTLEALALGMGHDLETIMEAQKWHLGYLPSSSNKKAMESGRWASNIDWLNAGRVPGVARLGFNEEGNPTVEFEAVGEDAESSRRGSNA